MARLGWVLVFMLLVACGGGASDKRDAHRCLGFQTPDGWRREPLKTGGDGFALMAPAPWMFGEQPVTDNFQVGFVESGGKSLKSYKDYLVSMMNQQGASQMLEKAEAVNKNLAAAEAKGMAAKASDVTLGKDKGYRVESALTISLDGKPFTQHQQLLVFKIGSHFVQVIAGWEASREAEVKPLAEAFLASINFDDCSKVVPETRPGR